MYVDRRLMSSMVLKCIRDYLKSFREGCLQTGFSASGTSDIIQIDRTTIGCIEQKGDLRTKDGFLSGELFCLFIRVVFTTFF